MQLKVSSITNLTDARFFSAIGTHYLGFCFDALDENNITIQKAKEIMDWLHEPIIVGEFGLHQTKEEIEFITQQLTLNEIQVPFLHSQKEKLAFDKFLAIENWHSVYSSQFTDFLVVKVSEEEIEDSALKKFISINKVFIEVDFTKKNILSILENLQPYGIQITCKKEEKIGLSLVDEYAELLEMIGFS